MARVGYRPRPQRFVIRRAFKHDHQPPALTAQSRRLISAVASWHSAIMSAKTLQSQSFLQSSSRHRKAYGGNEG
jgi:hypothetical protein